MSGTAPADDWIVPEEDDWIVPGQPATSFVNPEGRSMGNMAARVPGLAARMAVQGAGQLGDFVADSARAVASIPGVIERSTIGTENLPLLPPTGALRAGAARLADAAGLPQFDRTGLGAYVGDVGEAVSGGSGLMAGARAVAPVLAQGAARTVATAFGDGAAVDMAANAGGAVAARAAQDAGLGQVGEAGVGLGGGLASGLVAQSIIAAVARRRGMMPEAVRPESVTPDEVTAAWADPDVQRIAQANGITDPTDPRLAALQPRVEARRGAEAERAGVAPSVTTEDLRTAREAVETGADPSTVAPPVRRPVPDVVALPDQSQATPRVATADGARVPEPPLAGTADPNAVPFDPRRLRSEDVAAREAFDLAEAQRQRVTRPDTRDSQPAGVRTDEAGNPVTDSARMGQDFVARSESPDPTLPRQTYRFTPPDPNVEFPGAQRPGPAPGEPPLGRTPFPDQPLETVPGDRRGAAAPEVARIEQQLGRLTARGEPAAGTADASQVARLRARLAELEGSAPAGRGLAVRGTEQGAGGAGTRGPAGGAAPEGGAPPRSTTEPSPGGTQRALPAPQPDAPVRPPEAETTTRPPAARVEDGVTPANDRQRPSAMTPDERRVANATAEASDSDLRALARRYETADRSYDDPDDPRAVRYSNVAGSAKWEIARRARARHAEMYAARVEREGPGPAPAAESAEYLRGLGEYDSFRYFLDRGEADAARADGRLRFSQNLGDDEWAALKDSEATGAARSGRDPSPGGDTAADPAAAPMRGGGPREAPAARSPGDDIRNYVRGLLSGDQPDPSAAARELNVNPALALAGHQIARLRSFLEGDLPKAAVKRIADSLPRNPSLNQWADAVTAERSRGPQVNERARGIAATRRAAAAGDPEAQRLVREAESARARRGIEGDKAAGLNAIHANSVATRMRKAAADAVRKADDAMAAYRPKAEPGDRGAVPAQDAPAAARSADRADAPDSGSRMYANPLADPEAWRRFLVDPIAGTARTLRGKLKTSVADIAEKPAAAWRLWADSARATLLHYRDRYSAVPGMRELVENLGATDPGSGRLTRGGYQETADAQVRSMSNRIATLLQPLGEDAAALGRVRDILTGGNTRAATPAERQAAQRVRDLLNEHHAWLSKRLGSVERELGYVRGRYFPRRFNAEAIQADTAGFIADATGLYRRMGLEADVAKDAATEWANRVMGIGGSARYADTPANSYTKGRTLPAETDALMRKWLVTDPREALGAYIDSSTRHAEFASRFGPNGEKFDDVLKGMREAGATPTEIQIMQRAFASATGTVGGAPSGTTGALAWTQMWGMHQLLTRALFASAAEPLAVGIRSGDIRDGFRALGDTWRRFLTPDSWQGDKARTETERAELLGVVGDAAREMMMAARVEAQNFDVKNAARINRMLQITGQNRLFAASRIAASRIAEHTVTKMLADAADSRSGTQRAAQRFLAEVGMDDAAAKTVRTWLDKHGGRPPVAELTGDTPAASAYRTAINRFVNESVINPLAIDRPTAAGEKHALARMAYSIMSFQYSFTRNVLIRTFKQAGDAAAKGLTPAERLALLAPVAGFAVLAASQFAMSKGRDAIFNREAKSERPEIVDVVLGLDRAGMFGNLSPIVNTLTSARYERDPSGALIGAYLGNMLRQVGDMGPGLLPQEVGGPNSPKTNNAEWAAARSAWGLIAAPAAVMGLAAAPIPSWAKPVAGAAAMYVGSSDMSRNVASAIAGERQVKPRSPGGAQQRGGSGMAGSGGIRGGSGISGGGGITGR